MPTPFTSDMMSCLSKSAESPARATAHSTPPGPAPFAAMWNGMLARVGSCGPVAAIISRPDTDSVCTWRESGCVQDLAPQNRGEHMGVDVSAGDDAAHASAAGAAREGSGHRKRAGSLGDDVVSLDKEAQRVGDLLDRHRDRTHREHAGELEHLGVHALPSRPVDE